MIVLHGPASLDTVAPSGIRRFAALRFEQVLAAEPYDYDRHGYMIVVEPGDTVAQLEQESGCCITRNLFTDARFGEADFSPTFEILEEHDECFEMVFILSDDGFAVTLLIPKAEGIERSLLALCSAYARLARVN
jgi:hypothetical protein